MSISVARWRRFKNVRMNRYRVDNVPRAFRPLYVAIAWTLGATFYFYYFVCRLTSRVVLEGPGDADFSQHAIYCIWHESWWPYFVVFVRYRRPHVLISDPAAYMKPVHTVFRLMGCRHVILGSSGQEGRRAANEAAALVGKGWSTTISPDGPKGPARVLKKGVLHMALQSGAPVVPLAISSSRYIRWRSWDSKRFPLPFSEITVRVQQKIYVTRQNFDSAAEHITSLLSE